MKGLVYDKALRGRSVTKVWDYGLNPIVPMYDQTGKVNPPGFDGGTVGKTV